jgi:hypothetical protein
MKKKSDVTSIQVSRDFYETVKKVKESNNFNSFENSIKYMIAGKRGD